MMYLTPELVLRLSEAGTESVKKFKAKGLKEGWVSAQRKWAEVTEDTGVGNLKMVTKEKGIQFLEVVVSMIAEFFEELRHTNLEDMMSEF